MGRRKLITGAAVVRAGMASPSRSIASACIRIAIRINAAALFNVVAAMPVLY
jgi:hypothetical protein